MSQPHLSEAVVAALQHVVEEAELAVTRNLEPFAAAIVNTATGQIVSFQYNSPADAFDPTGHAELLAVREACKTLHTAALGGHLLVSSASLCDMCAAAALWAGVDGVVYAADAATVSSGGFEDDAIRSELRKPEGERRVPFVHAPLAGREARPFLAWRQRKGGPDEDKKGKES